MNIKRYLQIVLNVALLLFHRYLIVVLKSKNVGFKATITATIGDVSYLRWFSLACFKKMKKLCIKVPYEKEGFNRSKMKMEAENESKARKSVNFILVKPERIKCWTSMEIPVLVWQKLVQKGKGRNVKNAWESVESKFISLKMMCYI